MPRAWSVSPDMFSLSAVPEVWSTDWRTVLLCGKVRTLPRGHSWFLTSNLEHFFNVLSTLKNWKILLKFQCWFEIEGQNFGMESWSVFQRFFDVDSIWRWFNVKIAHWGQGSLVTAGFYAVADFGMALGKSIDPRNGKSHSMLNL